jgi:hypothetical protein
MLMLSFYYTSYIPSQKHTIKIKELNFCNYKNIVKIITNNNDALIEAAFNDLIYDVTGYKHETFTFLDKLIILLTVRSVCILSDIELVVTSPETEKTYNVSYRIYDIIQRLTSLNLAEHDTVIKIYNSILEVTFGLPSNLFIDKTNESLFTTIKQIKINDVDIPLNKDDIIDRLPINVFKDAKVFLAEIEKKINGINLMSVTTPDISPDNAIEVPLTLIENSVLEFLKLCYRRDLLSIYELEYILTSKLKLPHDLVYNSTPAELMLYINFYNKEKSEQDKQQKRSVMIGPPPNA